MAAAGISSADHVIGDWFSVPDLRLRDHRFNVPLDYSLNRSDSPKISVFAREVVSGDHLNNIHLHQIFPLLSLSTAALCLGHRYLLFVLY